MSRNTIYALVVVAALVAAVFMLWQHHKRDYVIDPDASAGAAGVVRNGSAPAVGPLKPRSDLVSIIADASNDKYSPPPDGRLSDSQIKMYLKVRGHEEDIAQVARKEAQAHADAAKKAGDKSIAGMIEGFKTMGSAADMLTADIRAAKDLGYNTQEYLWVKSQVMAASSAAMMSKMSEATNASFDSAYTQMKKSYDDAKDDQSKKMYKEMLDNYDKQRVEMKKDSAANISPAVAYNQQLIAKYDGALNAIATEMSKWEEKPGDAQKSMDEFAKSVDKAVDDDKKAH